MRGKILLGLGLALGIVFGSFRLSYALSGSSFNAGRIMDDAVFYDSGSMSVTSIQNFLSAKVPVCDTNGTQPYAGTTRAAYSTAQGYPPPFICLKDYKSTTPGKSAESGLCNSVPKRSTAVSAAQIIYDVSHSCGINPKVMIVLLQKEQGLVTDDWPWSIQYDHATGFGCPDSSGCSATYGGFFNQVFYAARQFKYYRRSPDLFNFAAGQNNYIQYNPSSSCGGSNVYIQNQTTAGLYNYTPYQPNSAALNNLYGSGNSCSAYGNRNFWRTYIDWFGSTYTTTDYAYWLEGIEIYSDAARTIKFSGTPTAAPGGKYYARIRVRNMGNKPWGGSVTVRLGTSRPNDRTSVFSDGTWVYPDRPANPVESSVVPGEVGTFEFQLTAPAQTGSYIEHFNVVAEGKTWMKDIGMGYNLDVVDPLVVSPTYTTAAAATTLNRGESLMSPDKNSVLMMQGDGNLVLYRNFKPIWSSGTAGTNADHMIMQNDGNLVLYTQTNVPVWNTKTYGNTNARLVLQADGNLVIYSASNAPLWHIHSVYNPNLLSIVNKFAQNSLVFPGQQLQTADKNYRLVLQTDGNLVLYNASSVAIWSSKTYGKDVAYMSMQPDGNLVLYKSGGQSAWSTKTSKYKSARLIIQQDGNLVIYTSSGKPVWDTHTNGL